LLRSGYKFKKFGLEKSRINVQLLLMTNYYCSMSYIFYGRGRKKGKLGEGEFRKNQQALADLHTKMSIIF
jgi:hypothetical protein